MISQPMVNNRCMKSVQSRTKKLHVDLCVFPEYVSDATSPSVTPSESSIHTEAPGSQQPGSPASSSLQPSLIPETAGASVQTSPGNYSQDFTSASQSPSRQVNGLYR